MRGGILAVLLMMSVCADAGQKFTLTVYNDAGVARPAETIAVPFAEVQRRLQDLQFEQVVVRDAKGRAVVSQVTALRHAHQGPPEYDELLFQHDFAQGEKRAAFTVESAATPSPPPPSKVFARVVPERFDDFAWENDRIAHRVYGPGLETAETRDRMTSSGVDVWVKKVPYSVIDCWYRKGHGGLHHDNGEGLDFYEVGLSRGAGGTGIWEGEKLYVSKNWRAWNLYANGPLRAMFDLNYDAWDAAGTQVRETKRVIVDAGRNLDEIRSRFDFTPAAASDGTITVAIGLAMHPDKALVATAQDEAARRLNLWEKYQDAESGELGTGVIVAPEARFAGFAETRPEQGRPEKLALVKVKPGETIRYFVGGAWNKAGDIADAAQWTRYLSAWTQRLAAPVRVELSQPPP